MSWQGWLFMLIAWSFVCAIFFYSFYRVIFDKKVEYKKEKEMEDKT